MRIVALMTERSFDRKVPVIRTELGTADRVATAAGLSFGSHRHVGIVAAMRIVARRTLPATERRVLVFSSTPPLDLFVARRAHLDSVLDQKPFVLTAMRVVACIAPALCNRFVHVVSTEFDSYLRVAAAAEYRRSILQERTQSCRVRVVAGRAFCSLNRCVAERGFESSLEIVAGETSFLLIDGMRLARHRPWDCEGCAQNC